MIDIRTGKPMTRRSALTGLAGILAAGVAPAAVVRSMIGARNAAMFGEIENPVPYDSKVEWIGFTGYSTNSPCIDTGIIFRKETECEIKFRCFVNSSNIYFGTGDDKYYLRWIYGNLCNITYGGSSYNLNWMNSSDYSIVYTFSVKNRIVSIAQSNGTVNSSSDFSFTQDSSNTMMLFRDNIASTGSRQSLFYGFKAKNLSEERDMIPVRVGTVGYMYDRANPHGGPNGNGLYGTLGASFVLGPDVS